jgi:hypothetical protein
VRFLPLLLLAGCTTFSPVKEQVYVLPLLPRGGVAVYDISDGLPLISTPHRLVVWRDEAGELHVAPETSEANIFTALENVPATAGGMLQSTGGAALGAH